MTFGPWIAAIAVESVTSSIEKVMFSRSLTARNQSSSFRRFEALTTSM